MFLYSDWQKICKFLSNDFNCIRSDQILDQPENKKWIVIKHDVETNVKKALDIAIIESQHNICSTYYVQAYLLKNNKKDLLKISSLGHEVTYHYDVLDSNKGNFELATSEFKNTINIFNEMNLDVNTICPHGNPVYNRSGWSSNKDFFRNKKIVELFPNIIDIVVQLPDLLNYSYIYLSDASYNWKKIKNIESNDIKNDGDEIIKNYDVFFNIISKTNNLIISSHPHRWEKSTAKMYIKIYRFKIVRYLAIFLLKFSLINKVFSKFYYLAKKI